MAVRSDYIKKLMETKNSLDKQYEEVLKESVKNIIGDNAKDEVRRLLKEAEDEDSYSEEEVIDDTADDNKEEVIDDEVATDNADGEDDTVEDDTVEDATTDVIDSEDGEEDTDAVDDEVWDDLENCKSADGEYDCRGMDDENLIKVLKAMGPEDGIRVMSNEDGTIEIEVDGDKIQGTQEFVIDLDDAEEPEDFDNGEIELELESVNEGNVNLGYGPKQNDTAMTTDPDETVTTDRKKVGHTWEPELKKSTSDTRKTNDGDNHPFEESVNECGTPELEVEAVEDGEEEDMLDETMTSTENSANARGTGMTHGNTNSSQKFARNGHVGGEQTRGTGEGYKEATNESINFKKKINQMWRENKQTKEIIPELNKKLMESMVINASMGYIVRLLNENTTTVDEKKEISERFSKVNTLNEGKKLYETISEELNKTGHRIKSLDGMLNSQLAESKQAKKALVETTMYESDKVNEALDFMKRLDKIM